MTGNARKLCMGEMKIICEPGGIKLHMSVRYSPESNGVAERCAMLHDSGLPNSMWAGAFSTTTYVHNRTSMRALGSRTPFEALYRVRPDVSHFRGFGASCAIVDDEPTERLRKPSWGTGGYRVWDPKRRVVVESRERTAGDPEIIVQGCRFSAH